MLSVVTQQHCRVILIPQIVRKKSTVTSLTFLRARQYSFAAITLSRQIPTRAGVASSSRIETRKSRLRKRIRMRVRGQ